MNSIPFDPFDLHILWWNTWRGHIANAKAHPDECEGYCLAALIAQTQHVMYLALKINKLKREGIIHE